MSEQEENDIDLIEKYHGGKLSAEERRLLEARIKSDPVFGAMVTDYTDIIEGVKHERREKFKSTVKTWEAEILREQQPSVFRTYWKLAAVFLVLALAALYIFIPGRKETPQELYADYFVPYEDVITTRDESNPLLTESVHLYDEKKYNLAVESFSKYLTSHPDDHDARFYYGLSLLESGRPQESMESFDIVIKGNSLLAEQAEWYRALASLKLGDLSVTKSLLHEIDREGHDYRAKAAELLGKL